MFFSKVSQVSSVAILFTSALSCSFGVAQPKAESDQKKANVIMRQLLEQLSILKKDMVSEDQFTDKKNHIRILEALTQFRKTAEKSAHFSSLNTENFRFSREVLEEQIRETEHLFRSGSKSFARWKLNSVVTMCAQCHAQLPSQKQRFSEFSDPKKFSSQMDQAEFLFATRAYDKAQEIYERAVEGYPENKLSRDDLERSLERLLTLYARIRRDPQTALQKFRSFEANPKIPTFIRGTLRSWNQQLTSWTQEAPSKTEFKSEKGLLEFAQNELSTKTKGGNIGADSPHLVTILRTSGLLYEALWRNQATENLPEFLYLLALSEKAISINFFYSLSSMYLRECIVRGSGKPVARKCFQELEAETLSGYTGSRGTDVPPEVLKELDHYRQLLEPKNPDKLPETNGKPL